MAEKVFLGTLDLDISTVEKKVKQINEELGKLGVGTDFDISKIATEAINKAITKMAEEIKKAVEDANNSMANLGKDKQIGGSLESTLTAVTSKIETTRASINKTTGDVEAFTTKVATGFDAAGNKVKEYTNSHGEITRMTVQEGAAIEQMLGLYEQLYQKKAKLHELELAGKSGTSEYLKLANDVQVLNEKLEKFADLEKLDEVKPKIQEIKDLFGQMTASMDDQQAIKEYADNLEALYKKITDFNNQVAKGKLVEGTDEYQKAQDEIGKLGQTVAAAAEKIGISGQKAAEGFSNVRAAAEKAAQSQEGIEKGVQYVAQAEVAYKNLKQAISNYNDAKKAGDTESMAYWKSQISGSAEIITNIGNIIDQLGIEGAERDKIVGIINQARTAQMGMEQNQNKITAGVSSWQGQISSLIARYASLMTIIRAVSNVLKDSVSYVSKFYDQMNEIQIITGKSNTEIAQMGNTYKSLAKEMSVSSNDIAEAAIYFARQGLEAEVIEERLRNTTQYAKTANIEFERAAELITAVANSMNLVEQESEDGREASQRVADVFMAIGDNAATSGEEIGTAMQKAAAAAGAFGVEFEWLASAIAAVSETTRQEATTIGTAFNTIIARLHNIRTTGYNQEDETKINDIAKALSKIDIALLDNEGNWRKMEDIFQEVGDQWGSLDDKTKSYIATTMAGVKQQNVFLALMEDLSKKGENASRMWELYGIAMDSAGTAASKYETYLDSITAAQNRLQVAQEGFYSLLQASVIKDYNNALAGMIEWITKGTEAFSGLNIIIPVVALAFYGIANAMKAAGGAAAFFSSTIAAHPILLAVAAAAALAGVLTGLAGAIGTTEQRFEAANSTLKESQANLTNLYKVQSDASAMFSELSGQTQLTDEDLKKYNTTLDELSKLSDISRGAVDAFKDGLLTAAEAAGIINNEIERLIANEQRVSAKSFMDKYSNYTASEGEKFSADMLDWIENLTGGDASPGAIGQAVSDLVYGMQMGQISSGMYDIYEKALSDVERYAEQNNKSHEEAMRMLGTNLMASLIDGMDPSEYLTGAIEQMVSEAVDIVGVNMDESQKGVLTKMLMEQIIGDDNVLNRQEYLGAFKQLTDFVWDAMLNGFDFDNMAIDAKSQVEYVGEQLFGEFFSMLFGDQLEQMGEVGEGFAADIQEAFNEIMSAGAEDLARNMLQNVPLDQWDDAVSILKDTLQNRFIEAFGTFSIGEIIQEEDLDTGDIEEWFAGFSFDELDLGAQLFVLDMVEMGTSIEELNQVAAESESVDDFIERLKNLKTASEDLPEGEEEVIDWAKQFKDSLQDFDNLDKAITSLKDGKAVSTDDLFNLADAHPEIYQVINDAEKLAIVLETLRAKAKANTIDTLANQLLNDEKWFSQSQWAMNISENVKTGQQYMNTLVEGSDAWNAVSDAARAAAEAIYGYSDATDYAAKGNIITSKTTEELADQVTNTKKEIDNLDSAIKTLQGGGHVSLSDILSLGNTRDEIIGILSSVDNLEAKLSEMKTLREQDLTSNIADWMGGSNAFAAESPFAENVSKTLGPYGNLNNYLEYLNQDTEANAEEIAAVTDYLNTAAENVLNATQEMEEATETWLEAQAKTAEENANANWAESNGYIQQIQQMQQALADDASGKKALEVFNNYDTAIKNGIANTYPNLVRALAQVESAQEKVSKATESGEHSLGELEKAMEDSAESTEQLGKELNKAEKFVKADHFKDTAKAIKDLEEGTISATDAYEVFNKECDKVTKAGDEIVKAEKKISDGTELVESDVNDLATVLGVSAQSIIDDFPGAVDVFNQLIAQGGSLEAMFNALNEAAFIRITGTSVADFSALQNGLLSVEGLAAEVIEMLVKTGQWKLTTLDLPQEGFVLDPTQGWIPTTVEAHATVLEPAGSNPFGGGKGVSDNTDTQSSGGGGGGGGGGGSSNYTYADPTVTHNAEEALERINRVLGIQREEFEGLADVTEESQTAMERFGKSAEEVMLELYNGNVDLLARPLVDAAELVKKGWEDAGEGIATVFSTTYEHQIEDVYFGINLTPILPNGEVLTEEELNDYFDELVDGATSMSDILSRDAAENGGMNLVINIVEAESMDEAIDHAVELAEELHELQEEYYLTEDATEDMTDATEDMTEATDEAANVVPALTVKSKSLGQSVNYTTEQLNDMAKAISELSNADLIDIMERVQTIIGYQQSYYQAQQSYYEQTGQMQGYIAYLDEERELLEEQNEALKDNIAALEVKMEATETALNGMSKEDEGYQDLKEDLEKLQDTHASYTQTVIENDTAILKLAEDAEEAADSIRQMEIDIRQLIYDAIEDREEKRASMRDARISMEDEILGHIKANYEREKDAILDASDAQIDALNDEKDAIKDNYDAQIDAIKDEKDQYKDMMDDRIDALKDEKDAYSDMMSARIEALNEEKNLLQEQLDLRKQQNEEQDKQAQLEQLEIQYQQILADPTRAKDAQSIKSKIDKLRDEISWSDAEKAVKAQQNKIGDEIDSLNAEKSRTLELMDDEIAKVEEVRDATIQAMEDQISAIEDQRDAMVESLEAQIDAMNDYKDYIEDFYDDLLDNSEQVMNEMANVMEMTDDEIIEWLKQNDETYAKASASTQEKMEEEWRATLDEMHGNVQTYWDEVEEIFQQGDEAIIEFLKENSAEYAEAGQLQAEAYVDEWKEKLEELRLAYEDVAGEIQQAPNYNTYVDAPTNSGESTGDSGGGGGGGGNGANNSGTLYGYRFKDENNNKPYDSGKVYASKDKALTEGTAKRNTVIAGYQANKEYAKIPLVGEVETYLRGGLANSTGLAWLDGTPEEPERILSPYQTQLFDSMVRALETAAMAPTYKMHDYGEWAENNDNSTNTTFGDIIVNVDNLDTDDDYEELAEKVSEVLLEKIGETTVVGGIRLGRY